MRYLIDTNIFVYLSTDAECLSKDVAAIIQEPDTLLYISAESIRELIVGYHKRFVLQALEIGRNDDRLDRGGILH